MLKYWMVWRYLQDGRKYLGLSFVLSVLGVALGVASLVVAMAVVSGYESTLRNSVVNLQGHVMVVKRGGVDENIAQIEKDIESILPEMQAITPFVVVEGLIVHDKKLSGVVLEGFDPKTANNVLSVSRALTSGVFLLGQDDKMPAAMIGKGIATKFDLDVGEVIKLVVPVSRTKNLDGFKPKIQRFKIAGILDLGRTDYDERYIVTDIKTAQQFGEWGERISGWRLKLSHHSLAEPAVKKIEDKLGFPFWARSWVSANRNLFQAVKYERIVIFVIVFLMIIAAAFNVSSTLYLSVVKRYSQISILKAMGVSSRFVRELFTRQGLLVGFFGASLGVVLGLAGCKLFLWAEKRWGLFPGEVYKLDHVDLEVRAADLAIILLSTMLICYLATLAPARKGAKLLPVEGLRYE